MIICFAANPSVDVLYEVRHLKHGAIHRPNPVIRTAGGKALNMARVAWVIGDQPVRVTASLGGSSGEWIESELEATGIEIDAVEAGTPTRSCVSVADRLTEFYESGVEYEPSLWEEMASRALDGLRSGDWLSISGSMPTGTPTAVVADLIYAANTTGARVAVDLTTPWLQAAVAAEPDIVKVNAAEAGEAFGETSEVGDLLAMLAQPSRLAVITNGPDGAIASDGKHAWHAAIPATGRYPVGSGDAMLAGLVVAATRSLKPADALRLGTASAAANAQEPGAGRLSKDAVESLAPMVEISER